MSRNQAVDPIYSRTASVSLPRWGPAGSRSLASRRAWRSAIPILSSTVVVAIDGLALMLAAGNLFANTPKRSSEEEITTLAPRFDRSGVPRR